jgi:hypothetical protein
MAKAAQNKELKAAFEKHRGETEGQVELGRIRLLEVCGNACFGGPKRNRPGAADRRHYAPACRAAV